MDLTYDAESVLSGAVVLDPYQREPITAQYDTRVRVVVIMAPEQTGKSTCWRFPLLHKLVFHPGPRWIIYESDDKAEDINSSQFEPLLRSIPDCAQLLEEGRAIKRRYELSNGSVVDFCGAGAAITSKPKRDGVADELDTWPLTRAGISQNLRNFRKRFRTYWRQGEGCLVVVSSPLGEDSPIGDEYEATSRGCWYLRCQKCEALTIPSHAVHHLQWETTPELTILPDSLRLECPKCGHEHAEDVSVSMNERGAYVHERPEIEDERGYQWGALASPRAFGWLDIARAQMAAGRTADPQAQAHLDNSVRGLPFRPRKSKAPSYDVVKTHRGPQPDPEKLSAVFMAADTQDAGWYWIVRGVDAELNTYLLGCGFCRVLSELAEAWDAEYLGVQPVLCIVDEGGHGERPKQVVEWARVTKGVYTYKGNPRIGTRWKVAKEREKLILANPYQYQADLLYYIHTHTRREKGGYWYLPDNATEEYMDQIATMRPDEKRKHGDRFENWVATGPDHYFDAEKMWLVMLDFAREHLRAWRVPVTYAKARAKPRETRRSTVELNV